MIKKNYKKILTLIEKETEEDDTSLMVKNIFIYNFGIDFNYSFKNKENVLFGFSKVYYFIREYNNYTFNKIIYENKQKKEILKKKFEEKKTNDKNITKFLKLIEQFQLGNYFSDEEISNINSKELTKIVVYNSNIDLYTSIIKDYTRKKIMIQTQKNELKFLQNEENNITENKTIYNENDDNNSNKKECNIY